MLTSIFRVLNEYLSCVYLTVILMFLCFLDGTVNCATQYTVSVFVLYDTCKLTGLELCWTVENRIT